MKIQEAIQYVYLGSCNEAVKNIVIDALEKQIPKKPIIKYGDDTITHNLGRLMCFHCPNCGKYIVALYETDVENGGGIHKDLKGCSTCLQAIDFTGYYHIDKLDEEIEWSDYPTEKGGEG